MGDFLQSKISPNLEEGRPKDRAYTIDVVSKLKEIIKNSPKLVLDPDELILIVQAHQISLRRSGNPSAGGRSDNIRIKRNS